MALTAIDTYQVTKNGNYDKTTKLEDIVKINKDLVVMYKELELEFDPNDSDSEEVAKIWLSNGSTVIVKKNSI